MQRVFNFSGGKTSAYMTIKGYKEGDIVLFCDTGREHPKTYKFINDFEAFENIPITRLNLNNEENPFDFLLKKKKYKCLPNRVKRFCTVELKINVARRYMRSLGLMAYENIIGFRADEPERVKKALQRWKKVVTIYPLYNEGIIKAHINAFWETKPYNLEIPSILGNCTLCFMKGKNAIAAILASYPELADIWINDEEQAAKIDKVTGSGRRYFEDITIRQLRDYAQNNLFKDYDLTNIKPAFNCACTA